MMRPLHRRFEVEDVETRQNYTFVIGQDERTVSLYDTSLGKGNRHMETWGPGEFPDGHKTARSYFDFLFDKSLRMGDPPIMFIGYVDEHFRPIEEE